VEGTGHHGGESEASGAVRSALENGIVALFKDYYGRGPTAAKAWVLDDYVIVVLDEGLTRSEQTMVAAGREEEVRRFRMAFEETVRDQAIQIVAQAVGRRVLDYHSQILFRPTRSFEIFVLESRAPEH
jgi:uncharacterized protein YbcI